MKNHLLSKTKYVQEIASPYAHCEFNSARLREIYSLLKLASGKKSKEANLFLKQKKQELRDELKNNVVSVYYVSIVGKNYTFDTWIPNYSELFSLKRTGTPTEHLKARYAPVYSAWKAFQKELKQERENTRKKTLEKKELLGFSYETIGNTFVVPGSIIALQSVENQMVRIKKPKKPNKDSKYNYVGVELELNALVDRETLNKEFCKKFLAGYIHVKDDSSINRENNTDFSHEVTILCTEQMIDSVITRICDVLNSSPVNGYVNNSCGMHVHIDARNRNVNVLYNNLYKALPMLSSMVPKNRIDSSHALRYCKINTRKTFDSMQELNDRYYAINTDSYSKYSTIENRLHSGTINATKIINWIKIMTLLANKQDEVVTNIYNANDLSNVVNVDSKLSAYITKRQNLFASKLSTGIDTRSDHFFFNDEQQIQL